MSSLMVWKTGPGCTLTEKVLPVDEDHLLCGPQGNPDSVELWPGFGKEFPEALAEISAFIPDTEADAGTLPQSVGSSLRTWIAENLSPHPSILETCGQDEVRIVPVIHPIDGAELGLAALMRTSNDDEKIAGLLLRPDLCVEPLLRKLGIGRALVAAELLWTGTLPTWEHDKPGYSHAGEATVRAGYDLAKQLENQVNVTIKEKITCDDPETFCQAMKTSSLEDLSASDLKKGMIVLPCAEATAGLAEILVTDLHVDGADIAFSVTATVTDPEKLSRAARAAYVDCWGDGDWVPDSLEEALAELTLASNANPSPDVLGFAFTDKGQAGPTAHFV